MIKTKKIKGDGSILTTHKGVEKPLFLIAAIVFSVQCASLFLPILWMFIMSFKTGTAYSFESAFQFPKIMSFKPFAFLLDYQNYTQAYKNLYHEMSGTTFFGLVFNSIWFNTRHNYYIISLLLWSLLASVHITFLYFRINVALIYLFGVAGQIVIVLWSSISKPKSK